MMLAETVMARELTYFAATEKDKGHRCDIEAGMAKLRGARRLEQRRRQFADSRRQRLRARVRDQPGAVRCADFEYLRGGC